jgi:Tfp pilus assembly protein PilF
MDTARDAQPRHALEAGFDRILMTARQALDGGHHHDALRLCEQVLAVEPLHAAAWRLRSKVAERQERISESLMCLRRALQAEPDRADWHHHYGRLCRRAGRLADAASALRTAIRLRPYRADSMVELGFALAAMGGRDDAQYWAARALQIDPDNPAAQALLEYTEDTSVPESDAA